jgi:Secretion system C-terminal sorting domain
MKLRTILITFLFLSSQLLAQLDNIKSQWPVTPLNSSHSINGNFSEFRNTGSSDHFHNAVDIGEPDGEPCYSVMDGEVYVIGNSGSNSYVRVASKINGKWKHFTYLHIDPNPNLSVGDAVEKGVTILGTIYPGLGHVHLIERELVSSKSTNGTAINNTRNNGGLTPYDDPYPPVIYRSSLKFFLDGSSTKVPAHGLTGKIDIQVKIEERNGTSSVHQNNGTYLAGFRIWSQDTSQIVYEPKDAGVKYRFDRKPFDSSVHKVFVKGVATLSNPVYWLTNGQGAEEINDGLEVSNNYFDTSLLDTGSYVLEIFTEDTRGNKDDEFFVIGITDKDLSPPERPELYSLVNGNSNKSLSFNWNKNPEKDLRGYRLYYAVNNNLSEWQLAADESQLTREEVAFSIESPANFIVPPTQDVYYFRLTAIDSSGNESSPGDIYARSSYTNGQGFPTALIVNGFNRYGGSGSWQKATHSFVKSYFEALSAADSVVISSCSNQAVSANKIILSDYDFVIWFLGDESTVDETFSTTEQGKIKAFLKSGGKLFLSGSEVGWDLDHKGTSGDKSFYHDYLKAEYVYDGNGNMSPAKGVASSSFEGTQLSFGQVYPEDWPDDINPVNGANRIMNYNEVRSGSQKRIGGIAYSGEFGGSTTPGKLVYIAFPFETVSSLTQRSGFMKSLLNYFDVVTGITSSNGLIPQQLFLSQNYPNPFNPQTHFDVSLPFAEKIKINIYDMLGRQVETITDKKFTAGNYTFVWDATAYASGFYMINLLAGDKHLTRKILLVK